MTGVAIADISVHILSHVFPIVSASEELEGLRTPGVACGGDIMVVLEKAET